MERTIRTHSQLKWVAILAVIAIAWDLTPLEGDYVAIWVNAVLAVMLIWVSARVHEPDHGRAVVVLSVLPLARLAGVVVFVPLATVGMESASTDLMVAVGAVVAWMILWDGTPSARWRPHNVTIVVLAMSAVLGFLLEGREPAGLLTTFGRGHVIPVLLLLAMAVSAGFGAEYVFRGPAFDVISSRLNPVWAIALFTALWLALALYRSVVMVAALTLANVAYGICRARGERTFWLGLAHGLLNGVSVLLLHP